MEVGGGHVALLLKVGEVIDHETYTRQTEWLPCDTRREDCFVTTLERLLFLRRKEEENETDHVRLSGEVIAL